MANQDQENFRKYWAQIIAKCWSDPEYKKKFLKNPTQVFKDEGVDIPKGVKINVYENNENTFHLILPTHTNEKLTEEQLKSYAGGAQYTGHLCQCQ